MFENPDLAKPVNPGVGSDAHESLVCAAWMPKNFKIGPVDPKIGSKDHPVDPNAQVNDHPDMVCALWMPKDFKIGPVNPKI